jgi:hypothetical protein
VEVSWWGKDHKAVQCCHLIPFVCIPQQLRYHFCDHCYCGRSKCDMSGYIRHGSLHAHMSMPVVHPFLYHSLDHSLDILPFIKLCHPMLV